MGLFNFLGGKKSKEEEAALLEQQEAEKKEQEIAELKEKHKELGWPVPGRLNPIKIDGQEDISFEDPLSDERKNEIGELVYEEDINAETIRFLSLQELLFLLTVQEKFQKEAPIPGYEANHRKVYNEILNRIRDAKTLFVLFDLNTGYPFIDHGYINIYSCEEYAQEAVKDFEKQFNIVG